MTSKVSRDTGHGLQGGAGNPAQKPLHAREGFGDGDASDQLEEL